MTRPILITGASGFLGSHVVAELCKVGLGSRLHLMLRSKPDPESLLGLRFRDSQLDLEALTSRIHYVDFKDGEKFNAQLKELKNLSQEWIVIHLAAIINSKGDDAAQEQVNFERTRELLEWSNENASRFVYTSSIVAFGGSPKNLLRSESDYNDYHWFNKLDGYSRSKRKAHDAIIATAKVATVILCPGIIHGAYEHKKSSRAHLETILSGKARWVPGGKGAFVSLDYVGQSLLKAALSEEFKAGVHVRLLNDVCLQYVEYFQMYRDCAGKEKIKMHSVPTFFLYLFVLLYGLLRLVGLKATLLGKAVQAFMNYDFKTERTYDQGKGALKAAISESFAKRG